MKGIFKKLAGGAIAAMTVTTAMAAELGVDLAAMKCEKEAGMWANAGRVTAYAPPSYECIKSYYGANAKPTIVVASSEQWYAWLQEIKALKADPEWTNAISFGNTLRSGRDSHAFGDLIGSAQIQRNFDIADARNYLLGIRNPFFRPVEPPMPEKCGVAVRREIYKIRERGVRNKAKADFDRECAQAEKEVKQQMDANAAMVATANASYVLVPALALQQFTGKLEPNKYRSSAYAAAKSTEEKAIVVGPGAGSPTFVVIGDITSPYTAAPVAFAMPFVRAGKLNLALVLYTEYGSDVAATAAMYDAADKMKAIDEWLRMSLIDPRLAAVQARNATARGEAPVAAPTPSAEALAAVQANNTLLTGKLLSVPVMRLQDSTGKDLQFNLTMSKVLDLAKDKTWQQVLGPRAVDPRGKATGVWAMSNWTETEQGVLRMDYLFPQFAEF